MEHEVVVGPWRGDDGLVRLLTAYHLATEAEKGSPVASAADLPERYRREVADPARAFARDTVLVARSGEFDVGCVVLTAPAAGSCEIKRLWVDAAARGRGIAGALVRAALRRPVAPARCGCRCGRGAPGPSRCTSGSVSAWWRRGTSARAWCAWSTGADGPVRPGGGAAPPGWPLPFPLRCLLPIRLIRWQMTNRSTRVTSP